MELCQSMGYTKWIPRTVITCPVVRKWVPIHVFLISFISPIVFIMVNRAIDFGDLNLTFTAIVSRNKFESQIRFVIISMKKLSKVQS